MSTVICARCHTTREVKPERRRRRPKGWVYALHPIDFKRCVICEGCAKVLVVIWSNPSAFSVQPAQGELALNPQKHRQTEAFQEQFCECHYCGRKPIIVIQGEPRCSWHATGSLGGDGLRIARAASRSRTRA